MVILCYSTYGMYRGWQGKLVDQMEGLKKRLGEEMSVRSSHEHELISKSSHIDRLQHQLEDAMKKYIFYK